MVKKFDCSLAGSDYRELSFRLLYKPNYVPDIIHEVGKLSDTFVHMNKTGEEMYGVFTDKGLVGFFFIGDIVPEHEGVLFSWFWDRFPHGTIRFMRDYVEQIAWKYGLCRITARTIDDKMHGHILEMCGMKLESRAKWAYKSGGRLQTLYTYRKLFPVSSNTR